MTIAAVCVHVHMSDNRRTLCDTENCWLPVDVENRETLRDDKSGLHAYGEERKNSRDIYIHPSASPGIGKFPGEIAAVVTTEH